MQWMMWLTMNNHKTCKVCHQNQADCKDSDYTECEPCYYQIDVSS